MEQLNNLDVVFLIIVGISALVGIARGMTKELLSIVGWVLAALAVFYLVPIVEPIMQKYIASKMLANLVSGLAILIVFCIFWILTADRLGAAVRSSRLSALDRILGFVFGAARGVLIVILVALLIGSIIPEESQKGMFKDSQYFKLAQNSAEPLKKLVPGDWLDKLKAKTEEMVLVKNEEKAKEDDKSQNAESKENETAETTTESFGDKLKKAAEAVDNLKTLQKSGEELFNELAQPKTAGDKDGDDLSSDLDMLLDVLEDRMVTTDEKTPALESESQNIIKSIKDKMDKSKKYVLYMALNDKKLGIVAGGGDLPQRLREHCQKSGREFFVVAIEGNADKAIFSPDIPHKWIRIGQAGTGFRALAEQKVAEVLMIGTIHRPTLADLVPDLRTAAFFAKIGLKALGDDGILRALIKEFEHDNMRVVGIQDVMPELLVKGGVLTKHKPDKQALADIERGIEAATMLGRLDIGQSVVVQQGLVLGVEGIEGTDELIKRCGSYQRKGVGAVLVKLRKPQQDMRIDLPTIGSKTIENLHNAGMRGVAIHAGNALIVDEKKVIDTADKYAMFIVGIEPKGDAK